MRRLPRRSGTECWLCRFPTFCIVFTGGKENGEQCGRVTIRTGLWSELSNCVVADNLMPGDIMPLWFRSMLLS